MSSLCCWGLVLESYNVGRNEKNVLELGVSKLKNVLLLLTPDSRTAPVAGRDTTLSEIIPVAMQNSFHLAEVFAPRDIGGYSCYMGSVPAVVGNTACPRD